MGPVLIGEARDVSRQGGIAGWLLDLLRGTQARRGERHMRVIETIALGGRRQVTLISCDGQRFLVGGGVDGVETIVLVGGCDRTRPEEM